MNESFTCIDSLQKTLPVDFQVLQHLLQPVSLPFETCLYMQKVTAYEFWYHREFKYEKHSYLQIDCFTELKYKMYVFLIDSS